MCEKGGRVGISSGWTVNIVVYRVRHCAWYKEWFLLPILLGDVPVIYVAGDVSVRRTDALATNILKALQENLTTEATAYLTWCLRCLVYHFWVRQTVSLWYVQQFQSKRTRTWTDTILHLNKQSTTKAHAKAQKIYIEILHKLYTNINCTLTLVHY